MIKIELLNKIRTETEERIQEVFDELEKNSKEFGIDEFGGHKRNDFIIKFDRFEYLLKENGEHEYIRIRLGIYLEDKENIWLNSLEPIGEYLTVYDLDFEFIDEFITIESKENNFGIRHWVEILNNVAPDRYCKRNILEYEFVTYINHSISLFQGRNFEGVAIFIKRCLDYLETPTKKEKLDTTYLNSATEYLRELYYYLKRNNLIDIEKYNIEMRINTKS